MARKKRKLIEVQYMVKAWVQVMVPAESLDAALALTQKPNIDDVIEFGDDVEVVDCSIKRIGVVDIDRITVNDD